MGLGEIFLVWTLTAKQAWKLRASAKVAAVI